jgi:hypothetical protein
VPTFKGGIFVINGHGGMRFELTEQTWQHIVKDNSRKYFEEHLNKIVETLKSPDIILGSPKESNVKAFVKFFENFCLSNAVKIKTYLYVLVNLNNIRESERFISIRN